MEPIKVFVWKASDTDDVRLFRNRYSLVEQLPQMPPEVIDRALEHEGRTVWLPGTGSLTYATVEDV